jgi:hypothetical protein
MDRAISVSILEGKMLFFDYCEKKGISEISLLSTLRLNYSKCFPLEARFISAGGVRGIKASKKMPFLNAKIVRCPSGGYYKKGNFL